MKLSLSLAVIFVCALLGAAPTSAQQAASGEPLFTYYHKGKSVPLHPSANLVALDENSSNLSFIVSSNGLVKDPLSARAELKKHALGLYRPAAAKGKKGSTAARKLSASVLAASTSAVFQPVFEQGGAILIPSDEVLVGFKGELKLAEAESYLARHAAELGIVAVRPHRQNTFIVVISNPSNGRAFEVARALTQLERVSFSEPNLVVLQRAGQGSSEFRYDKSMLSQDAIVAYSGEGGALQTGIVASPPNWSSLASLDFESTTLPAGWRVMYVSGRTNAFWGNTTYRRHGGSRSLYCAGAGTQGVAAPGPVPVNVATALLSPQLNLSGYQEVYLELWFYAKNELESYADGIQLYDYPAVVVVNDSSGSVTGRILAVAYDGDCTKDPTTSNGWRRLLYRVPPSFRAANVHFEIQYLSDESNQTEGTYIDDLRIVGTSQIDSAQLSNDTYSGRQYELKNTGQLAGLVNGRSDLHIPEAWDAASVSPDIVVAVIDGGVELNHPDLNLVTGYDPDGSVGGQARADGSGERGSHGTNCAGNVGAIRNNGIGVSGTAPGVKIMPVYQGSTLSELAAAIDVAVRQGAKVLSNSWGWVGSPSTDIENAVQDALQANRVVLFAAGNGPDRPPYTYDVAFPGSLTETTDVICVGASSPTDEHKSASSSDGNFSWGSSYVGAGPDVCAPGPWSYSTDLLGAEGENDGTEIDPSDPASADYNPAFGGTSSATPKVAGIVALMLSKNPNLTPAQVKSILKSSADDIEAPGEDDKTGAGRVNASRAVLAVPAPVDPRDFPSVTTTLPVDGAADVPLYAPVRATFSIPMDGASITGAAFALNNGASGTVSYDSATRIATFTPSGSLRAGTTYTATISSSVTCATGKSMTAPKSWSFTTASLGGSGNLVVNGDFEGGMTGWGGAGSVSLGTGSGHNGSNGYLATGGSNNVSSQSYQDLAIPSGNAQVHLRFWYKVTSAETGSRAYDTMTVQLEDPGTGQLLQSLRSLSNLDAGQEWLQSEQFDVTSLQGRQVRLNFITRTDSSLATTFLVDDVAMMTPGDGAPALAVYLYRRTDGTMAMTSGGGGMPMVRDPALGSVVGEGDFNGDGVRDFVWWNGVSGEVHLQLMSDAVSVQGMPMVHREPDTTWRVAAAGDFDGDHKTDLVWHNSLTGAVNVMLLNGAAQTGNATVVTEPDTAWKVVAAADVNGDSKSDLIWWHALTGEVAVSLMNGTGATARQVMYQEPDTSWRIVGAGDINADGKGDLIWKHRGSGHVYAMLLDGTAVAGGAMIYREPDENWEIVGVGNYNGDNSADLLWRNASTGMIYLMPLNGLSVAPGATIPSSADMSWQVVGQQQQQDGGNGEGATTAHRDAGHVDWYNSLSGSLYAMLTGSGAVTGGALYYREADTSWRVVGHGDFNGDGVTDTVWRNEKSGQVYLQYMKSDSEVQGGFMVYQEPDTNWRIVATGDLSGDGRTDLLWWNSQSGQVYGMLVGSQGIAGGAMIHTEPDTRWKVVAVADVDGNGKGDLIWWNTGTGQVALTALSSVGPAATPVIYTEPDTNWRIAGAGDVNADGKADLIWHNRSSGQVYAMLLNGAAIAGGALIHTEPDSNWEIVSVGNYNNDGKADLLWWNRASGSVYLMPMDGLRAAPGYAIYREPDTTWRIQGETEWRDRAYGVGVTTTSR